MNKEITLAQMQELLDRKNEQPQSRSIEIFSYQADFGKTFHERDLQKYRRDTYLPNHSCGNRPRLDYKR